MHDMKEKLDEVCEMKHQLVSYVHAQMAMGLDHLNTEELGKAIDMIKDLAETEKACHEACYYEAVTEAMDEYDEDGRAGYPKRDRMGRYAASRSQTGRDIRPMERMGYIPDPRADWHWKDDRMDDPDKDRYGRPFSEYRMAKRNFTSSHSEQDKQKMKEHANEHVMSAIASLREIWDSADPELRNRMKADMQKLVNEMN